MKERSVRGVMSVEVTGRIDKNGDMFVRPIDETISFLVDDNTTEKLAQGRDYTAWDWED